MTYPQYIAIGVVVTVFCIWWYRPYGQSKKKYELYYAAIGPVIWPLLAIKWLFDRLGQGWKKRNY